MAGNQGLKSQPSAALPNNLAAAIAALQRFYVLMGKNDITELPGTVVGDKALEADVKALKDALANKTDETDSIPSYIIDNLIFVMLDNTEAAYFTHDLVTDTTLLSHFEVDGDSGGDKNYEGIEKYVKIIYEHDLPNLPKDLPFYRYEAGRAALLVPRDAPAKETDADGDPVDDRRSHINWDGEGKPADVSTPLGASIKHLINTSVVTIDKDADGKPKGSYSANEPPLWQDLNENPRTPNKFKSPCLSAYIFPNHRVSPATRGAAAVSLFVNAIPTIEMSRCTPYLDIKFISAVPVELGKKTGQISLLRFLGMSSGGEDNNSPYDKINLEGALPQDLLGKYSDTDLTKNIDAKDSERLAHSTALSAAGMELFTAPQTLVNANLNKEGHTGGSGTTLNTFAPFLSLQSFKVSISGLGNALFSNKTGNLSFILHDRSRMADIAPLIAPSLFGHSYLQVEYGWSHPDGDDASENAYGALLNAMRVSHQFNIQSSDFSIEQDGQVRIDMKIASRGSSEIRMFPIVTGDVMPAAAFKSIMASQLSKINKRASNAGHDDESLAEIRGRINISMNAANSSSTLIPRKLWRDFMSFINPKEFTPTTDAKGLLDYIQQLIGDPEGGEDKGAIADSKKSFVTEVERKLDQLLCTNDPFFDPVGNVLLQSANDKDKVATTPANIVERTAYVSLGKVIMTFIGAPLAASSKFDEVQVMFYSFNNQAAAARNLESIASFEVDKDMLKHVLVGYAEAHPSMSIAGFMRFLNKNLLSKPDNANYGMNNLYKEKSEARKKGKDVDKTTSKDAKAQIQNDIDEVNGKITERLVALYQSSDIPCEPIFRPPKLALVLESLPAFKKNADGGPFSADPTLTILRIHVFDEKATPHESEMFLHNAMNDSEIAKKVKIVSAPVTPPKGSNTNAEGAAIEGGVVKVITTDKSKYEVILSNVPNSEIKRIIKQTVPSLTFGLGFTALNSFSMSSTTSGPVGNVLLLNAITPSDAAVDAPPNQTSDFEDITVYPSNASMDMLGCPLLEFGQQFFVDLNTGTTADNIYRITQIDHTITPGEFRTSATLSFNSSGTIETMKSMIEAGELATVE